MGMARSMRSGSHPLLLFLSLKKQKSTVKACAYLGHGDGPLNEVRQPLLVHQLVAEEHVEGACVCVRACMCMCMSVKESLCSCRNARQALSSNGCS